MNWGKECQTAKQPQNTDTTALCPGRTYTRLYGLHMGSHGMEP